ncbi:MAG: EF-P lysine aminoacylase GenX [Pseudomonadales bacterium]|nr:EF-P lysine aminoacylase GenX [Pseudomonadales bacterium]
MLCSVREYFASENVLEVETPLLCSSTAMDPHLQSFNLRVQGDRRFLQTSPEFPMKRLLAQGSGSIYQICKAFREDEAGRNHNPEFTLLEWYRVGWDLTQLQQETVALIQRIGALHQQPWSRVVHYSYGELFQAYLAIDPFVADVTELQSLANQKLGEALPELDRLGWLDLLLSQVIEPAMPSGLVVVTDFPAEQAALAKKAQDAEGHWVAKRFEVYLNGIELANGYQELVDPLEQRQRFLQDNQIRQSLGLEILPVPDALLSALAQGVPECAGVALGLDRLLMLALGKSHLAEVLSFDFTHA